MRSKSAWSPWRDQDGFEGLLGSSWETLPDKAFPLRFCAAESKTLQESVARVLHLSDHVESLLLRSQ